MHTSPKVYYLKYSQWNTYTGSFNHECSSSGSSSYCCCFRISRCCCCWMYQYCTNTYSL